MTTLTFITEETDLNALFAPYAAPATLTDTFSDPAMNRAAKRIQRALIQGKPNNVVDHYRAELAACAAKILMLIPNDEYILLMHNETTWELVMKEWAAIKKANGIAADDATYDAIAADIPFTALPYK